MTLIDQNVLAKFFYEAAKKHSIVGAQMGLSLPGKILTLEHGVLNSETNHAVTKNSLFEIGSISKVWTTVLIMQLIDEGKFQLDDPVAEVLHEFKTVALKTYSPAEFEKITIRQLLSHTSGLDGDLFFSTGRGDDAVQKYVAGLADSKLIHPVGDGFSYCNSGFVVAGRIIEQYRETTWDEAVQKHLVKPLGLSHTETLPENAIMHDVAVGHTIDSVGKITRPLTWGITRGMGPAGSIASNNSDQLIFAQALLNDGVATNKNRILSKESARLMREKQVHISSDIDPVFSGWGLGWFLEEWGGQNIFGHDGGTIAQRAFLRVFPETATIFSLHTNSGDRGALLYNDLIEKVCEMLQVSAPIKITPNGYLPAAKEIKEILGVYETDALKVEIKQRNGNVFAAVQEKLSFIPGAELKEKEHFDLQPFGPKKFVLRQKPHLPWESMFFYDGSGGKYVSYGHRSIPKTDQP